MRTVLAVAAAAIALTAGAAIAIPRHTTPHPVPVSRIANSTVDSLITAQEHLRRVPGDWAAWAQLGLAYVERARTTADPAYYPKADGALATSIRLRSGNVDALVGLGALANARHDFIRARDLARQAIKANAYSSEAWGVLADALTQLGSAAEATQAVQKMLDLRPGLPSYARAAYDLEQRGRITEAAALWEHALLDAHTPADVAYPQVQLGDLAWHTGDVTAARDHYGRALAADPASLPARAGMARVTGNLALWAQVTQAYPSPSLLIEYAGQLRGFGHEAEATEQLNLAAAALSLFAASGGQDDLGAAELDIARGSYVDAVKAARREWKRRQHSDVAGVLAWALYLSGDSRTALGFARKSVALGTRNSVLLLHMRIISASLGQDRLARLSEDLS
jgi:tetratricopeptide (TPR) repeat protein